MVKDKDKKIYELLRSDRKDKKFMLIDPEGNKSHFGAEGYSDYTLHQDKERRKRYIKRHANEQEYWTHTKKNLMTPSYLSRYVLWERPDLIDAIKYIAKKQKINVLVDL